MKLKDFIGNSTHIMVAFDRSGSFDPESDIGIRQLDTLRQALVGFQGVVEIVAFDHRTRWIDQITRSTQVMGLKIPNLLGGTSITSVMELARGANVQKLVIFTDGFFSDGAKEEVPTLFVFDNFEYTHGRAPTGQFGEFTTL